MTTATTPIQTASGADGRWDRRMAAHRTLSVIDAKHTIALIEWLAPIARCAAALLVDENHNDPNRARSRVNLANALDRAEDFLLVQHGWAWPEVHYRGAQVIDWLAEALTTYVGAQPHPEARLEERLSVLAGSLP